MQEHEFAVGDLAVYPAHGVAKVEAIESRELGGQESTFYVLRVLDNNMRVMVPITKSVQVGLRTLVGEDEIEAVYEILRTRELAVDRTTWNRRQREYTEKIRTGSIFEVAEVMRDLCLLRTGKDLSFGERKMLDTAKGLLLKELSVSRNIDPAIIEEEFDEIFVDVDPSVLG
ncbi:MAG: CarD family transcriptional regulator [Myxococcota bacterium]|jgi:CarD family transcriptional regulator|nr:CarD family transcriptional regulator [Myxococcota bacterium]